MKLTLYDITIPQFIRYLSNLGALLKKGERSVKSRKLTTKKLLTGRLAPDMYNTVQQVQYAYFMALEAAVNLSGRAMPTFAYKEKTLGELMREIARAIRFLKSVKPKECVVREGKSVKTFLLSPKERVTMRRYINELALPNFYFHVTTAYDILRHLNVPLSKDDYLGLR